MESSCAAAGMYIFGSRSPSPMSGGRAFCVSWDDVPIIWERLCFCFGKFCFCAGKGFASVLKLLLVCLQKRFLVRWKAVVEGILSLSLPSGSEVRQKSQRGANVIAARCVGLRSALHLPSHRSALLEQKREGRAQEGHGQAGLAFRAWASTMAGARRQGAARCGIWCLTDQEVSA